MKLEVLYLNLIKIQTIYHTIQNIFENRNEKNILDILKTINKTAKFGFKDCENFDLVINGVYVKKLNLEEILESFGKELTIEPISIRRQIMIY